MASTFSMGKESAWDKAREHSEHNTFWKILHTNHIWETHEIHHMLAVCWESCGCISPSSRVLNVRKWRHPIHPSILWTTSQNTSYDSKNPGKIWWVIGKTYNRVKVDHGVFVCPIRLSIIHMIHIDSVQPPVIQWHRRVHRMYMHILTSTHKHSHLFATTMHSYLFATTMHSQDAHRYSHLLTSTDVYWHTSIYNLYVYIYIYVS